MPYIPRTERARFTRLEVESLKIDTPGELNYAFSIIMRTYLEKHGKSYTTINEIIGAIESAKAEFQRRVVAPYEDLKIQENTDVYGDER